MSRTRTSEVWTSVSYTSIKENSELKVLKYIKFCDEIFTNWPNYLFGTRLFNRVDNHCLQYYN